MEAIKKHAWPQLSESDVSGPNLGGIVLGVWNWHQLISSPPRSVHARFVRLIFKNCIIYRNGGDPGANKYRGVIIFVL